MTEYTIAKYIRLSTDDGTCESMSIPHQRLLLDRHIDSLDIANARVLEFVDNGYSGTNMERPAVQELLELARSGGVDMICVKDFSRFSRNSMDSGYFIEQVFPLFGVRFASVGDGFDSDDHKNDTGGLDVAFKFLMHDYYCKDLSLKVKSALNVKRVNGEPVNGFVPYGYRVGADKRMEINPETAPVIRLIFKMALDGHTMSAIRDELVRKAIPTPSEYRRLRRGDAFEPLCRWEAFSLLKIIANEVYAGTYISNKYERTEVGSHSVRTDPDKWFVIRDNHPAIVSKEDFERVQRTAMVKGRAAVKENAVGMGGTRRVKRDGSAISIYPLYGYMFNDRHEPEINPVPAEAVRMVFRMTLEGRTAAEISETLTQSGYPSPGDQKAMDRGEEIGTGKAWSRAAVNGILREFQYTGTAVSGRSIKYAKAVAVEARTLIPRFSQQSEWRLTPNARPAIVSEAVFNEAQEVLANRPKTKAVRDHLLKGLVRCGCCDHALHFDNSVADNLYRCRHTVGDPRADCHRMKVAVTDVEGAVLAVVRKQAEVVLGMPDLGRLAPMDGGLERADIERRIEEAGERRHGHYERYILQEIGRDEFVRLKNSCSDEIDGLEKRLAALKAESRSMAADENTRSIAERVVGETVPHKELVGALIEKVLVFPGNRIEIVWKIADFAAG